MIGPDLVPAPPGPPMAGMTLWLKRGTYAAGTWPDASGNGFDAVGPGGAGNPTAGALHGHPSPSFDPAQSQYLGVQGTVAQVLNSGVSAGQVWALFVVFSYTGATAFGDASNTPYLIMHDPGILPLWGACVGITGGILDICGYNYEETGSQVLTPDVTVAGPTAALHFMSSFAQGNGAGGSLTTTVDAGANATHVGTAGVVILGGQTIAVGACGNPPVAGHPFYQGLIGELIVYAGPSGGVPLSAPDLAAVNAYLASF